MEDPLRPPDDPGFRLIETFGFAPDKGCARLKRHLARMSKSAARLGIGFDKAQANDLAGGIKADTALRCRLTLDREGRLELDTTPMPTPKKVWCLGIAPQRLNHQDEWLRHKTTQRHLYDRARAAMPEGVDELVFLNERDEVCEGTITNIFVHLFEGDRVTPPERCGLLPGVLRQSLLDRRVYQERVLTLDDLRRARSINIGNSLRGLCHAKLVWPPHSAAFKSAG